MGSAKLGYRGRVLLVGAPTDTEGLLASLAIGGFDVQESVANEALNVAARSNPDAIVVAARPETELADAVRHLRGDARTRRVPVLVQGPQEVLGSALYRGLPVDELLSDERAKGELDRRLEALVRAKRLVDNEERARSRLTALLDISQAAAGSLELAEVLRTVVRKLSEVVRSDRCAVLLTEKTGEVVVAATVEAPELGQLRLDLSRYPELALALGSRETVVIEDARTDPRMGPVRKLIDPIGVRSILVQPLISGGEVLGALFLRQIGAEGQNAAFDDEDRAFAQGAAAAVADHLRNAKLHAELKRKRDELEAAYVDRYRELGAANRRLKEANQFKDELIATLSHDLRAPLNVLLGHGQILQDELDNGQHRMSVDAIVRQGRKILELVESLLEKGKGEAGRLALEPAELDLAHQAMEAARELEILGRERNLTIRVEAPLELWTLADRIKIRQVLQNILQNAIKHARTRVTVHCERVRREGGDQARISVVDDGPGIAAKELPVIFDRYRHGKEGTGLGLAICREFVELHGGEIWAENPESGGAAFRMLLPLKLEASGEPVAEKPRVLLVEDETEVAQAGMEILRTRYRVEVARDGAEGVAKARALKPDLVLMDVFLPKVDGLDAAAALRGAPDTAHIPVVLISSHPEVADKVRALHLGVTDLVSKPFEPRQLLEKVGQALQRPHLVSATFGVELPRSGVDPTTGLLDRDGLLRRAQQEHARARRYERPLAAVALRPKVEPAAGQLAQAARLLKGALRISDIAAHFGGGALVVLLPECSAEGARASAARLEPLLAAALGELTARAEALHPRGDEEPVEALLAALTRR